MASPNSAMIEAFVMSLEGYSGELADNITKTNAVMKAIDSKGNKRVATGRDIVQEIEYAENGTVQYYSGAETFDISPSEVFTGAVFNYKQVVGTVTVTGLEEIQNSGREQIHNLVTSRLGNLKRSMKNFMGRDMYADGTGSNGKQLGGLGLLVADTNTNTVGGISASAFPFWQNYVYSFAGDSKTASTTTIQHAMNLASINTTRGSDSADIIVADQIYWMFYLESLQANQRFTDEKGAGAGFKNLMYGASTPVVYDDVCPASHMYFLNTDYLFLRPAKGKEFKALGEKSSVNQDALVLPTVWAGNMTTSNRKLQGVIKA